MMLYTRLMIDKLTKNLNIKIAFIALAVAFSAIFVVTPVNVAWADSGNARSQACGAIGGCGGGGNKIQKTFKTIIEILSAVGGIIAVIMIIVGGIKYMTAGGDSNSISSAKNTVLYSVVGLIIIAFAQVIVRLVLEKV